jgi:hypothetical protein
VRIGGKWRIGKENFIDAKAKSELVLCFADGDEINKRVGKRDSESSLLNTIKVQAIKKEQGNLDKLLISIRLRESSVEYIWKKTPRETYIEQINDYKKIINQSNDEVLDSVMSRQEFRNRQALLNYVRTVWIEGVLEKYLHNQVPFDISLENRPDAVASWNLDTIAPDKSRQILSEGMTVNEVFEQLGEGGTLLILGEPASGKTTKLLQLAKDLIARAEQNIDCRIPIVLQLSAWAEKKQPITKWIIEELNAKYHVNRKIAKLWVDNKELLLLLDGLDEIQGLKNRKACVRALNTFQQEQATEMVVCCRLKEYEQLDVRLELQSALVLQPANIDKEGFCTSIGIKDLVQNSRNLTSSENMLEIMLVFQTQKQKTWLVSTNRQVFFLLDDEKRRSSQQIIQYRQALKDSLPVTARKESDLSGIFQLGSSAFWYYSLDILGNPEESRLRLERFVNTAIKSII